ncbi:MAG: phosphopantothenate/pantothenate synthetase [Methanomicrobiales archaeon]|nr:phosphopantothenate/pantothenate synthetase [Methanomicrobiales archaeon]
MIPESHPRYLSLKTREHLATCAKEGIVSLEGLTAHGRGEAFDYLLGEKSSQSALNAEKIAAALLLNATHPVISVNGNTAALAAKSIGELQQVCGAIVEVNLFHRTQERVTLITHLLEKEGVKVISGEVSRYIPLDHDRGLCHHEGIHTADVILVPLEDGDRAEALVRMGKTVIAIDLNPLSRTTKTCTLPIIDEVTRAIPNITRFCSDINRTEIPDIITSYNRAEFIRDALEYIRKRLVDVLD